MRTFDYSSPVIDYVKEEVVRQGHDVTQVDGLLRTSYMLDAWAWAMNRITETMGTDIFTNRWGTHSESTIPKYPMPTVDDILQIAKRVEPNVNARGFREYGVQVGNRICVDWKEVPRLVVALFESMDLYDANEFYKEFEIIHPFGDGNGRTGKILLNWMEGTLAEPIMPPDFFGGGVP